MVMNREYDDGDEERDDEETSPEEMARMLALVRMCFEKKKKKEKKPRHLLFFLPLCLFQMKTMGKLGESTLREMESQTAREVQSRAAADSPMLPRLTASRVGPSLALPSSSSESLLGPPDGPLAPACLTSSRLAAQIELQSSGAEPGGLGLFALASSEHPAWTTFLNRTKRAANFTMADFYADSVPGLAAPAAPSVTVSPRSPNPFFQETGPHHSPPPPAAAAAAVQGRTPRGERSASVWEQEVQGEAVRLVVCCVQAKAAEKMMQSRPRMLPHTSLLTVEIQLQQLAREGKCFHVVAAMEDVKAVETLFSQSADQWSHQQEGLTSRLWVAQPSVPGLQRMLMGSKHVAASASSSFSSGLRLWRSVWRKRPADNGGGCLLLDYLVAPHPELHRARPRFAASLSGPQTDDAALRVSREAELFRESREAVLNVLGARDLIVTHELSSVRLLNAASRQLVRSIPVSARRVRVANYQLFVVCADDPPRVMVFDLVNENTPPFTLLCPDVIPTDILIRPLGQLKQISVLACGPDRMVHVWNIPKISSGGGRGSGGAVNGGGGGASGGSNEMLPSFSMIMHRDYVTCMEASAEYIFSGSCDCTIGVWDHQGARLAQLTGHTDWIFSLALVGNDSPSSSSSSSSSSSGVLLLSCSRDATLRLWQTGGGVFSCIRTISTGGSRALSCSLQGTTVAVSLGNNRIALADLADSSSRLRLLSGHAGRISALVFWRGLLFSSSVDHSVRVWDPASSTCLGVLRGHSDSVNGLHLASDVLFSASDDNSVRMWRLPDLGLTTALPETPRSKSGLFKPLTLSGKFKTPKKSAPDEK